MTLMITTRLKIKTTRLTSYIGLGPKAGSNDKVGEIKLIVTRVVNVKIMRRRVKKLKSKPLKPIRTHEELPPERKVHESCIKGRDMHCVASVFFFVTVTLCGSLTPEPMIPDLGNLSQLTQSLLATLTRK